MIAGKLPFFDESILGTIEQIRNFKITFNSKRWTKISNLAKDLLKRILHPDPSKRLSAESKIYLLIY